MKSNWTTIIDNGYTSTIGLEAITRNSQARYFLVLIAEGDKLSLEIDLETHQKLLHFRNKQNTQGVKVL